MSDERLIVDLAATPPADEDAFWDAVAGPLALPDWFGRNLDAWIDTIEGGDISLVVDAHRDILIRVRRCGLFDPANERGAYLVEVTENDTRARFEFVD